MNTQGQRHPPHKPDKLSLILLSSLSLLGDVMCWASEKLNTVVGLVMFSKLPPEGNIIQVLLLCPCGQRGEIPLKQVLCWKSPPFLNTKKLWHLDLPQLTFTQHFSVHTHDRNQNVRPTSCLSARGPLPGTKTLKSHMWRGGEKLEKICFSELKIQYSTGICL